MLQVGHKIDPLGDGISKIEFMDSMGDDLTVVNAARVSFDKQHDEFDEVADTSLIRFLARNNHWTPFAQVSVQLRIKMPLFVAREWFRHNVGLTRNEVSRRYVSTRPELYVPSALRMAVPDKKQGSTEDAPYPVDAVLQSEMQAGVRLYNKLIKEDIAPEQARMVLPQSMYTEFIETGSLAAYSRLYSLRYSKDAMKEIQLYAGGLQHIMTGIAPVSWEHLCA